MLRMPFAVAYRPPDLFCRPGTTVACDAIHAMGRPQRSTAPYFALQRVGATISEAVTAHMTATVAVRAVAAHPA